MSRLMDVGPAAIVNMEGWLPDKSGRTQIKMFQIKIKIVYVFLSPAARGKDTTFSTKSNKKGNQTNKC